MAHDDPLTLGVCSEHLLKVAADHIMNTVLRPFAPDFYTLRQLADRYVRTRIGACDLL
jgi:hypothetical protein